MLDVLQPRDNLIVLPRPPTTPRLSSYRRGKENAEHARPRERIVVLGTEAHTPTRPVLSRSGSQPAFRRRRFEAAPVARPQLLAPATTAPAMTSSRSAPTLSEPQRLNPTQSCGVTILPAEVHQRARSTPMRRPVCPTTESPRPKPPGGALGESLNFSSSAMLRDAALRPLGLPAAKIFFDPTTGRSIALRCSC